MGFFDAFSKKVAQQPRQSADTIRPKTAWDKPPEVQVHVSVPEQPKQFTPPFNIKKIVLYIGIGVAVVAIVVIALTMILRMGQQDAITITVQGSQLVKPGEQVKFSVTVQNTDTANQLDEVSLTVKADSATVFPETQQFATVQRSLNPLLPNQLQTESFSAIFWGKQRDTRKLDIVVRYKLGSFSNRFEKTVSYTPTIASDAMTVHMQLPQQVLPDQSFVFSARFTNTGTQRIEQGTVRIDLPDGFVVAKTDPNTQQNGTNILVPVTQMDVGAETTITVQGSIHGDVGQGKQISMHAFTAIRNTQIELASTEGNIAVISSPLALSIALNDKPDYALTRGESAAYTLTFRNNASSPLKDIIITADVSDPWFELDTIEVRHGSFSSKDKLVTWTGGTAPNLLTLDPQEAGSVTFAVRIHDTFTANQKNNTIMVRATISASNRSQDIGTSIASKADILTKINGAAQLDVSVWYKDRLPNGFTNTGPLPPRANQMTQYSVHWKIAAQGNDFTDMQVQTTLPPGVNFTGKTKGDSQGVVYNPRTNQLVWTIPQISAYTTKELVFQINALPSIDQVGKTILVLDKVTMRATDAFTQNRVSEQTQRISSDLPNDPSVGQINGRVTQ